MDEHGTYDGMKDFIFPFRSFNQAHKEAARRRTYRWVNEFFLCLPGEHRTDTGDQQMDL